MPSNAVSQLLSAVCLITLLGVWLLGELQVQNSRVESERYIDSVVTSFSDRLQAGVHPLHAIGGLIRLRPNWTETRSLVEEYVAGLLPHSPSVSLIQVGPGLGGAGSSRSWLLMLMSQSTMTGTPPLELPCTDAHKEDSGAGPISTLPCACARHTWSVLARVPAPSCVTVNE